MGFMDRFRGIRTEATQRIFGTSVKKNAPPTYINDFITGRYWFHDNVEHQARMMRMNPYAWAVTHGVANSVFEDDFRFISPQRNDNNEKVEIMQDVKKRLDEMECLKWFALSYGGERGHGHTWLYVGTEELQTDSTLERARVTNLDVFTPEYATVTEWDEIGAPKTLTLKVLTAKGHEAQQYEEIPIPVKDCVLIRTRPFDRSHEGIPITGPIWNSLVSTTIIDHAITTYAMKMGLGALILKTKGTISTEDTTAAQTIMEDLSVSRVGVIPGKHVETLEFVGASSSAVDFASFTDIFINEIAAGTRIPKSIIIGAADVAAGVEVGPGEMANLRQGEQRRFEPFIREVVRRMNGGEEEYEIDWPVKTAIDRREEAEIRYLEAQAEGAEASAESTRKMTEQGRGPNDISVGQERPKDQKKNQNPAGAQ
jgi:hypothetical protein